MSRGHDIAIDLTMSDRPTIAAFRPPDHRAESARTTIEAAGANALLDPMLVPEPTGDRPRDDADWTILTSVTAAGLPAVTAWSPENTRVAAIGPKTADALADIGIEVDIVPETYTSDGLVAAMADEIDGARIELARSDHGSDALPAGLQTAGAYVHETVLYRLGRPADAGDSIEGVIAGAVDALAFSSSLTVAHFLETADELGMREALDSKLDDTIVGVIGPPTAETARSAGLAVDVVASEATFEALIDDLMAALQTRTRSA